MEDVGLFSVRMAIFLQQHATRPRINRRIVCEPLCIPAVHLSRKASSSTVADADHFVYIVECNDGTFYTGYTTDVDRRVAEHNEGTGAKYTCGRRPVELVHVESFDTQSGAMQREYAIKQLDRSAKERLIRAEVTS